MMPGMAGALPIPGTVPGMAAVPGGGGGGGMGSLDDNFDAEKKAMQVMGAAPFRRNSGAIRAQPGAIRTILPPASLVVQARMLNANPTKVVLLKNMFRRAPTRRATRASSTSSEDVMEASTQYEGGGGRQDRQKLRGTYMAFTDADGAKNCLTSLNGRWFQQLAAEYCQEDVYEALALWRYGGARGRRGAHSEGRGKGGGRGAIWGGGARCAGADRLATAGRRAGSGRFSRRQVTRAAARPRREREFKVRFTR